MTSPLRASTDTLVARRTRPPGADDALKAHVLRYLSAGEQVVVAFELGADQLAPGRTEAVPVYVATDGEWVWNGDTEYYLEHHDLWPDPALVAHVTANAEPGPVDDAQLEAVEAWLASGNG